MIVNVDIIMIVNVDIIMIVNVNLLVKSQPPSSMGDKCGH